MKKLQKLGIILLSAILHSQPAIAQDKWVDISLGINTKNSSSTVKVEGNTPIPYGQLFGKLYLDATEKSRTDFENFFILITLTYGLENILSTLDGLGVAAEFNGGNGFRDTWRFGPAYERSFGSGNYTLFKFFPFNTGEDKEVQISIFFSQDFFNRLNYSTLFNYNFRPGIDTYYFEPQASIRIVEGVRFFVEGRGTRTIDDKFQLQPITGVKFLLR